MTLFKKVSFIIIVVYGLSWLYSINEEERRIEGIEISKQLKIEKAEEEKIATKRAIKKFNTGKSMPTMAKIQIEDYVKGNLKSPISAKFPGIFGPRVIPLGNHIYFLSSYVDAQNSFGAMLRTNFNITIEYVGTSSGNSGMSRYWKIISSDLN